MRNIFGFRKVSYKNNINNFKIMNGRRFKNAIKYTLLTVFSLTLLLTSSIVYSSGKPTMIGQGEIYIYDEIVLMPYMIINLEISEKDGMLYIRDKENTFTANIIQDRLDSTLSKSIKDYYGNKLTTEDDIFNKFIDLKNNLFTSMKEYYNIGFLYGERDTGCDLAMKVFAEYKEKVFGQNGNIKLYNTLRSNKTQEWEETHIDITIPAPSNKTIYSVNFTLSKGNLNMKTLTNMSDLLCSLYIRGLSPQKKPLTVFKDINAVSLANTGIYPNTFGTEVPLNTLKNEQAGYSISYPSWFMPYMKNAIIDLYDYRSFKMGSNHYFSITVRNAIENYSSGEEIIDSIQKLYGDKIRIIEKGRAEISDNKYFYFRYELDTKDGVFYVHDYYTVRGNRTFILELKSKYIKPSDQIKDEFIKVISSLKITPGDFVKADVSTNLSKYINMEGKYYISYPESWSISRDFSERILKDGDNEEVLTLENPLSSGPLSIIIAEGDFTSDIDKFQVLQYLAGIRQVGKSENVINYKSPYQNMPSELLSSYYYTKDETIYLIKLVNYLDVSSNRNKLCYAVDLVREGKIYSLFVIASDYVSYEGKLEDKVMSALVNLTANSLLESDIKNYSLMLKEECQKLLERLFNTKVEVSLPSEEYLEGPNPSNSSDTKYYTIINARFENITAYFGIEVNLLNGNIKITSIHPKDQIIENIKKIYSDNGTYDLLNYYISDSNQFEILVFLTSKLDGSFKIVKVKLKYNFSEKNVDLINLWSMRV
ncbi:MAG TPA: hypothetical protein GXX20_09430 [Clostridiaceae bacterium]|nr:hypothetical protein [Clostridiaceae bacterium]